MLHKPSCSRIGLLAALALAGITIMAACTNRPPESRAVGEHQNTASQQSDTIKKKHFIFHAKDGSYQVITEKMVAEIPAGEPSVFDTEGNVFVGKSPDNMRAAKIIMSGPRAKALWEKMAKQNKGQNNKVNFATVLIMQTCATRSSHDDATRHVQSAKVPNSVVRTQKYFVLIPEDGLPQVIAENADAEGIPLDRTQSSVLTSGWFNSPYAPDKTPGDEQYVEIAASGPKAIIVWEKMVAKARAINKADSPDGDSKPVIEAIAHAADIQIGRLFDDKSADDLNCPA